MLVYDSDQWGLSLTHEIETKNRKQGKRCISKEGS